MRQLRVMNVDDDRVDLDRLGPAIERAWNRQPLHTKITEFRPEMEISEAYRTLNIAGSIDLFIVDVMWPTGKGEEEQPRGLEFIESAAHVGGVALVGISYDPLMRGKCLRSGAHSFISKSSIYREGGEAVAAIQQALEKAGYIPYPYERIEFQCDMGDIFLRDAVERIGEHNLLLIGHRLMGADCRELTPFLVERGLSGSIALGLKLLSQEGRTRSYFLKLSRDSEVLIREYENREELRDLAAIALVPIEPSPSEMRYGGWYVLASQFRVYMQTLGSWLSCIPFSDGETELPIVNLCLQQIFTSANSLRHTYSTSKRNEWNGSKLRHVEHITQLIPVPRQARVLAAQKELLPFIHKYSSLGSNDLDALRLFVEEGQVGMYSARRFLEGALVCVNHGDLHSSNILVDPSTGTPCLIDGEKVGTAPLGSDLARLVCDLVIGHLADPVSRQEWSKMTEWEQTIDSLVEGKLDAGRDLVSHSISWLCQNSEEILGLEPGDEYGFWWELEWYILLAAEFLLCSARRRSYSVPRRVLSVYSSHRALLEASRLLDKDCSRFVHK